MLRPSEPRGAEPRRVGRRDRWIVGEPGRPARNAVAPMNVLSTTDPFGDAERQSAASARGGNARRRAPLFALCDPSLKRRDQRQLKSFLTLLGERSAVTLV